MLTIGEVRHELLLGQGKSRKACLGGEFTGVSFDQETRGDRGINPFLQ